MLKQFYIWSSVQTLERNILILSVFDYLYDGTAVTGRQRYDHPEKHTNAVRIEKTVLNEKVQELYGQLLLPVLYTRCF